MSRQANLISNTPRFLAEAGTGGFQEVWYLKLNSIADTRALWLRFTILMRQNHTKEIAEVWAIFFEHNAGHTSKTAVKQTWPLQSFSASPKPQKGFTGLHIAESYLGEDKTSGHIHDDDTRIAWDLDIIPGTAGGHNFVPDRLRKLGLVKNLAITVFEQQWYTGWCEVNGVRYTFESAPGMQGHLAGPKNGHSWAWGHCNRFMDEAGNTAPVIWDGLSARARIGGLVPPALTSMYLQIGKKRFNLNTVRDALHFQSRSTFEGWHFTTKKHGYQFEGDLTSRLDDFACVTYEDTDGSHLYCHNTKLASMTLAVTSPEGTETRYTSAHAAAYEVVTRSPHPNIPVVI